MKSDKPFRKSFICAGVLWAVHAILLLAIVGFQDFEYRLGTILPSCLFPAIITGTWGYFSKKSWSWLRFIVPVLILHFIFAAMAGAGSRSRRESSGPVQIDRNTFSVSLPKGWHEDKSDKDFDGHTAAFFQRTDNCFFTVLVAPKSAEVSGTTVLEAQKAEVEKRFANVKLTELGKWGPHGGKGFDVEATFEGSSFRGRLFGFESSSNACVVQEMASLSDSKTYADDFEKIRQTFKLK